MDGCVNGLDGLDLDVGFESSPGSPIKGFGSERVLIVRFASAGPCSLHFFIVTFFFDTHTEFLLCMSQYFKPSFAGTNKQVFLPLYFTSPHQYRSSIIDRPARRAEVMYRGNRV